MPSAVAALNIGLELCWGETCGDMLEAMARIAPSQPIGAMARIASRRNKLFYSTHARFFGLHSKLLSKIQIDSKKGLG